jgi:hypothetical protein
MAPSVLVAKVPAEAVHPKVKEGDGPAPSTLAVNLTCSPGLGTVSGHSTVMTGQTVRASAAAPGGVEGASAARRQAAMVKGSAALVIRQSFSSSRAMMSFWISVVPS